MLKNYAGIATRSGMHSISRLALWGTLIIITFLRVSISLGQTLPSGFSQVLVSSGITNPTVMKFAPDGRIFVAQQTGQLRVIKNGSLLAQPFVSLTVGGGGERGLLGIAFDPAFASNNYIYLYYTLSSGANNRLSRFTANGDVVVAGSESVILDFDPIGSVLYHNGGTIEFGPDGKLYVGIGDNTNGTNAQSLDTYHGKVLRINADGSVPAGNPFTGGSAQRQRVWAYGLRNPYTLTFQPGTGKLFVNDVGENSWEEINNATTGGLNFGWPNVEGTGSNSAYTNPVYTYAHGSGTNLGCAITGGTFINGAVSNYPSSYDGKYFYMDYCGNWLDAITISGNTGTRVPFGSNISGNPVGLTAGNDGNLYFLSRSANSVFKIVYSSTQYLNSLADAYVRGGSYANTNYGSAAKLYVKNAATPGAVQETYLRFDITSFNASLSSAKLRLYGSLNNTTSVTSVPVEVHEVISQTWQEGSINNTNKPAAQATVLAAVNVTGTTGQYYEWNLTQYIISRKNAGATSVSFLLKTVSSIPDNSVKFNSKEAAQRKPQLKITGGLLMQDNNPSSEFSLDRFENKDVQMSENGISVFPNPAKDALTIETGGETNESNLISVYDNTGRLVIAPMNMNKNATQLNVAKLKAGMYFLNIRNLQNGLNINRTISIVK